jgi:hypothetical protein
MVNQFGHEPLGIEAPANVSSFDVAKNSARYIDNQVAETAVAATALLTTVHCQGEPSSQIANSTGAAASRNQTLERTTPSILAPNAAHVNGERRHADA